VVLRCGGGVERSDEVAVAGARRAQRWLAEHGAAHPRGADPSSVPPHFPHAFPHTALSSSISTYLLVGIVRRGRSRRQLPHSDYFLAETLVRHGDYNGVAHRWVSLEHLLNSSGNTLSPAVLMQREPRPSRTTALSASMVHTSLVGDVALRQRANSGSAIACHCVSESVALPTCAAGMSSANWC
jgi:hypothetical protein